MHPDQDPTSADDSSPFEITYEQLHRMARSQMREQPSSHTLTATGLVHEVFLKLDRGCVPGGDWGALLPIAAKAMRSILVDHARGKARLKRGSSGVRVALSDDLLGGAAGFEMAIEIDDALVKLSAFDTNLAELVELRFFGGATVSEAAQALGRPKRRIERELALARSWLKRELG